jgi:hypothetical protein
MDGHDGCIVIVHNRLNSQDWLTNVIMLTISFCFGKLDVALAWDTKDWLRPPHPKQNKNNAKTLSWSEKGERIGTEVSRTPKQRK